MREDDFVILVICAELFLQTQRGASHMVTISSYICKDSFYMCRKYVSSISKWCHLSTLNFFLKYETSHMCIIDRYNYVLYFLHSWDWTHFILVYSFYRML